MSTRVYHPAGNSWQDVPTGDVPAWAEAGWLVEKPAHVDDSEALPPEPDPIKPAPKK